MNADLLHDAISLLPEDLLSDVDALRRRKRFPWKSVASVAACLCLAVGLSFLFPAAKNAMDSAENGNALPEAAVGDVQHSTTAEGILVEVHSVAENSACVFEPPSTSLADKNVCIQLSLVTLTFENLEEAPQLKPGQTIRIYYEPEQLDVEAFTVKPYKIEIIED